MTLEYSKWDCFFISVFCKTKTVKGPEAKVWSMHPAWWALMNTTFGKYHSKFLFGGFASILPPKGFWLCEILPALLRSVHRSLMMLHHREFVHCGFWGVLRTTILLWKPPSFYLPLFFTFFPTSEMFPMQHRPTFQLTAISSLHYKLRKQRPENTSPGISRFNLQSTGSCLEEPMAADCWTRSEESYNLHHLTFP